MNHRIQWDSHHGPAINVKDNSRYDHDLPEDEAQAIWEDVARYFWARAELIAEEYGYTDVYGEGRSSGWLVPMRGRYNSAEYVGEHEETEPEYIAEVAKFETFGAAIVDLLDACTEDLQAELQAAVDEQAAKAALLEVGTPIRWAR